MVDVFVHTFLSGWWIYCGWTNDGPLHIWARRLELMIYVMYNAIIILYLWIDCLRSFPNWDDQWKSFPILRRRVICWRSFRRIRHLCMRRHTHGERETEGENKKKNIEWPSLNILISYHSSTHTHTPCTTTEHNANTHINKHRRKNLFIFHGKLFFLSFFPARLYEPLYDYTRMVARIWT